MRHRLTMIGRIVGVVMTLTASVMGRLLPQQANRNYQGAIPVGATIKSVAISEAHACAIASDDRTYCWGENEGQFGNNSTTNSNSPVAVSRGAMPSSQTVKSLSWRREVAAQLPPMTKRTAGEVTGTVGSRMVQYRFLSSGGCGSW